MRNLFLLTLTLSLLVSCEKETDPVLIDKDSPISSNGYLPLEIGNYWIYQHVHIDSLNNEILSDRIDSIVVERDTLINGHHYFVLEGINYPFNAGNWGIIDMLRDSAGYIVTHEGNIRFSVNNFTDILAEKTEVIQEDTLYSLTYKMETVDYSLTVPAGSFEVLNFKGTAISYRDLSGIENPRYLNNLYALGVGKVLQTYFYFHSPVISEKRLIRYHINNEN